MCEATLSSVGHTSGERPASNFTGPDPRHQLRYGHGCLLGFLKPSHEASVTTTGGGASQRQEHRPTRYLVHTRWPSLNGISRSVLGANNSSSFTRRSVSPCSWVYWSPASIVARFGSMP